MKFFIILFIDIIYSITGIAQNITGKIVDKQGNAIQDANVALLQCNDSAFIRGVISDNGGWFSLDAPEKNGIIKVSCLGYKTIYKNVPNPNVGIIVLEEEVITLDDITAHVKTSVAKRRQPNQIDGAYMIQKE